MRAERRSLANERTALGWQRSGMSLAVIAALLLGQAVHRDEPLGAAAAVAVGAAAAWAAGWGRRLYRRRADAVQGPAEHPVRTLAAVTVAAAALAAAVLVGGR